MFSVEFLSALINCVLGAVCFEFIVAICSFTVNVVGVFAVGVVDFVFSHVKSSQN